MSPQLFNLLANSTFSMLAGLIVVGLCLWIFRVQTGRSKLLLLLLPFVKIIFDVVRGVPSTSVLLTGIDPFDLPPRSQMFTVGAGADHWGPFLNAGFSVQDITGHVFSASVGDYLWIWLQRNLGEWQPSLLVYLAMAISGAFLVRRFLRIWKFEHERRADRDITPFLSIPLWSRTVNVYVSKKFRGSPFTGGLVHPYICIPAEAAQRLSPEELRAVIAHETAHVKNFDILTSLFIQIAGDVFWFIPGYQTLGRRVEDLREILADRFAVKHGADPVQLASALLNLKDDHLAARSALIPVPTFLRGPSLLKTRVNFLIDRAGEKRARFGWQNGWVRALILFWVTVAVLMSTFGGNHPSHIESQRQTYSGSSMIFIAESMMKENLAGR